MILAGIGMAAFGFVAFGSAGPGRPGDAVAQGILSLLAMGTGGAIVVACGASLWTRFRPTAEGLEVRTLRGTRSIRWCEVTRVESSRRPGKSSQAYLTLEHPKGPVRIAATSTRDFDRLRGYVRTRVAPSVVRGEL